jgi:hypothetical protein
MITEPSASVEPTRIGPLVCECDCYSSVSHAARRYAILTALSTTGLRSVPCSLT